MTTKTKLTLTDLIAHVGLENIHVQRVDDAINIKLNKKHGDTEITFSTQEMSVDDFLRKDSAKMFGLVVWFPREKLPKP